MAYAVCRALLHVDRPAVLRLSPSVPITSRRRLHSTTPSSTEAIDEEPNANEDQDEEFDASGDPKPFNSIKGRINYDTLKALTVRPYTLKTMTTVQQRVTALLPDLVRPWDPEGIVPRKVPNPLPPNWEPPVIDPNAPRDLLVRSKTGTGKTFAYLIPAVDSRLNYIEHNAKLAVINAGLTSSPHLAGRARHAFRRASAGPLILAPTRELATQIANEALKLTKHQKEFEVRLFVGGSSKNQQMREWMRFRRDLVVATPGRIRELLETEPEIQKGLKDCPMVILDEADILLSMGFRDDIDTILSFLPKPPVRQTFLFGATLSRSVRQLASSVFSPNHAFIDASPPGQSVLTSKDQDKTPMELALTSDDEPMTHEHVPQFHTLCPTASDQIPTLLKLLAHDQLTHGTRSKVILFCPTVHVAALFATLLRVLGEQLLTNTEVLPMHSKMEPSHRTQTSLSFRRAGTGADARPTVLVTSDVSSRGMDYPDVTRVIQLGVPSKEEVYVHRIGRIARGADAMAPANGKEEEGPVVRADLLLLPWEAGYMTWQLTNLPIKPLPISLLDKQLAALSPESSNLTTDFLKTALGDLHGLIDPTDIRCTAASLLGYYLPLTSSLRLQPTSILSGISAWAIESFNVTIPAITKSPSHFVKSHSIHNELMKTKGLFVDGVRIAGGNPIAGLKRGKGGSIKGGNTKQAIWEGRGKRNSLKHATFTATSSFAQNAIARGVSVKSTSAESTNAEKPQVESPKKAERRERPQEAPERALPPHMRPRQV